MRANVFSIILSSVLFLAIPAAFAQDETTYVTAAWLIDTVEGKRVANPVVAISGDRIISVESEGSVPGGADVIDLGGATILPGLADTHTHLTMYSTDFGYESLTVAPVDEAIRGVANARKTLLAGFTAARNLGASGYSDVALRNAIDDGRVPGPRLQVSGPPLGASGGHCDNNLLPATYADRREGVADGPWALRRKVRLNKKYGADVIKICATGGTLSKGTDPGARQLTMAELEAIVDEAHSLGMPVAVHAHGTEGILFAMRAGADSIEHSSLIDEEGLELARRNGIFLSVNAYTPRYMIANAERMNILPESLEKAKNLAVRRLENYRIAHAAGAKLAYGTDSATYPHGDNAKQFAVFVELGMTPMEAIQSATTIAAESLGWVGDTGVVAAGYFADIIAVEGDPLADVAALEDVLFVMKGGKVYKAPE